MTIYQSKICSKCQQTKSLDDFYNDVRYKNRKKSACKECQKLQNIKRGRTTEGKKNRHKIQIKFLYNITIEEYNLMFERQNGLCAGCCRHQSEFKKRLSIDHCHKTNKIRGLLCPDCNKALGLLRDSIQTLDKLSKYLISFS